MIDVTQRQPDRSDLVAALLRRGRQLLDAPRRPINFQTGIPDAEGLLNNIEQYPHLFVFGCVMDRQIKFGRAWAIPYRIGMEIGGFEFQKFRRLSTIKLEQMFSDNRFHRFNKTMANSLHKAAQLIHRTYNDDASKIWGGNPSSALVVRRFLEFQGVGIKIATMAANILVREFKVPLWDLSAIDISPDSRVTRFFKENGLLRREASPSELIYLARELSPDFPGLLDHAAFTDGGYKRFGTSKAARTGVK
ncbi:MAG: hypothetical protein WDN08_15795 [Rhizomicrobium sp.]